MLDCIYLAMTGAELWKNKAAHQKIAYMACHFSAYGAGLSNIPPTLPPESILIVNDRIPFFGHDPGLITRQLVQAAKELCCSCVLLDLQRPGEERVQEICRECVQQLPCPVGITPPYAGDLSCAVFVPPIPPDQAADIYFAPFEGREIWLEVANEGLQLTLTQAGCQAEAVAYAPSTPCFTEEALHCSYRQEVLEDRVRFTLWRSKEQLEKLLAQAQTLGVKKFIGLYQQLQAFL